MADELDPRPLELDLHVLQSGKTLQLDPMELSRNVEVLERFERVEREVPRLVDFLHLGGMFEF